MSAHADIEKLYVFTQAAQQNHANISTAISLTADESHLSGPIDAVPPAAVGSGAAADMHLATVRECAIESGRLKDAATISLRGYARPTAAAARTFQLQSVTIAGGDSLWDIAERTLGDGNRWTEIYDANKDVLGPDPDIIDPAAVLKIPGARVMTGAARNDSRDDILFVPTDDAPDLGSDPEGLGGIASSSGTGKRRTSSRAGTADRSGPPSTVDRLRDLVDVVGNRLKDDAEEAAGHLPDELKRRAGEAVGNAISAGKAVGGRGAASVENLAEHLADRVVIASKVVDGAHSVATSGVDAYVDSQIGVAKGIGAGHVISRDAAVAVGGAALDDTKDIMGAATDVGHVYADVKDAAPVVAAEVATATPGAVVAVGDALGDAQLAATDAAFGTATSVGHVYADAKDAITIGAAGGSIAASDAAVAVGKAAGAAASVISDGTFDAVGDVAHGAVDVTKSGIDAAGKGVDAVAGAPGKLASGLGDLWHGDGEPEQPLPAQAADAPVPNPANDKTVHDAKAAAANKIPGA